MEIIIEFVLIDNLIINFLILFLTAKVLNLNFNKARVLFANLFGTLMALVLPLVTLPVPLFILLKLMVGVIMVLFAYKTLSFKHFCIQFLTFLSATALLGGVCFAVCYFESGSLNADVFKTGFNFPVGLIVLVLAVYVFFINSVIKYIVKKQKAKKFVYSINLTKGEKTLKANAYLDSGHKLKDPATQESITIINFNLFHKIFNIPIESILLKNVQQYLQGARYIDIQTINNQKQQMLIVNLDKIQIELTETTIEKTNAPVGLSLVNFKNNFNCDILISPEIF